MEYLLRCVSLNFFFIGYLPPVAKLQTEKKKETGGAEEEETSNDYHPTNIWTFMRVYIFPFQYKYHTQNSGIDSFIRFTCI